MTESDESIVSVDRLRSLIRQNWKLLLLCSGTFVVLAVIAASVMTPMYRASVVVFPVSEDEGVAGLGRMMTQVSGLVGLAGIQLGGGSTRYEYVAYLRSKTLAAGFISDEGLLVQLFSDDWDAAGQKWRSDDSQKIPSTWDGVKRFQQEIVSVYDDVETGAVTLSITWRDPVIAADWANNLIRRANEDLRARDIAETEASIAFLNDEISKTSIVELREAMNSLIGAQVKTRVLAKVREEYALRVIDAAIPPDADDFVSPRRLVMVLLAGVLGLLLGFSVILLRKRT